MHLNNMRYALNISKTINAKCQFLEAVDAIHNDSERNASETGYIQGARMEIIWKQLLIIVKIINFLALSPR